MRSLTIILPLALAAVLCACGPDGSEPASPGAVYPCRAALRVIDYSPAPGQFVNTMPEPVAGADMTSVADAAIRAGEFVTLGSWGGSITFELDKYLSNVVGAPDFVVNGNAFSGNAEPGIVQVSLDGVAWYTVKGERFDEAAAVVVKYLPPAISGEEVKWVCTDPSTGVVIDQGSLPRNSYHGQDYFPRWLPLGDDGSLSFTGYRLPDNGYWDEERSMFVLRPYEGYADSFPDGDSRANIDIDNAIDPFGNPVVLRYIKYVRVYTGVLQHNGPLGECSTEVSGLTLLHE